MNKRVLEKLDWFDLLKQLADNCQTSEGQKRALALEPNLEHDQISAAWNQVSATKDMAAKGYLAPIGEISNIHPILKASDIGEILQAEQLKFIKDNIDATHNVRMFAKDFANTCVPFRQIHDQLRPTSKLAKEIDRTIDLEGKLKDSASPELNKLRRQKRNLRERVENRLRKILRNPDIEKYIQDDFYTLRQDRYVVPMKLDGRGRIAGAIFDTSTSGQT